jgi:2-keto-3-deoxy-L-rhamnonate aldolase RhmA
MQRRGVLSSVRSHLAQQVPAAAEEWGGAWGQTCKPIDFSCHCCSALRLCSRGWAGFDRCCHPPPLPLLLLSRADDFNHPPPGVPLYNTCKQKLLDGKQVFSYTVEKLDVPLYLEVRKHYDFVWFEMQHSTMTYADVETMIAAGEATGEPGATPFLRIPDELESTIQKATDIGSLGLILPTVDTPEQALAVAKFARYPPVARRSTGAGQAPKVWQNDYMSTYNDNVVVAVMIETPVGVANAYEIASVPGVDVVFIGNFDLHRFSGIAMDDPLYQKMVSDIRDGVVRAGKIFGCANFIYHEGNEVSKDAQFFQNGPAHDGWVPPKRASAAIKGYSGPAADDDTKKGGE